jgi:hypothetical protein
VSRYAFARAEEPGASFKCGRGSAPLRGSLHDKEVCGPVRGGISLRRKAVRHLRSVGPVRARALLRKRAMRGSSPRSSPRGGGSRRTLAGGQSALVAVEDHAPASVPVHRLVCRSRQDAFRLREARHRRRGGSKACNARTERVNGSLALRGKPRTRERTGRERRNEGGSSERGDPHHVSTARLTKTA